MSRSNPTADMKNPASRWFEWKGRDGTFMYYDKAKKEKVKVPLPFTFIVLDRTATIRGYNKKMKTGLYSNEVRDTRAEPFVAKFFTGGVVAEGLWVDIKDKIVARSGKFGVNLYIAFKEDKILKLGAIQMTGCALGPWFDFDKKFHKDIFTKAVQVKSFKEDTSGDVEFKAPVFTLQDITEETNAAAIALDAELQTYLSAYFKRPTAEKAEHASRDTDTQPDAPEQEPEHEPEQEAPPEDESVPF